MVLVLLVFYYFSLPKKLFNSPHATVIESNTGVLLGAKIATDGQWRFPKSDTIPEKFKICITTFEDRHFNLHFGFNPISIIKAAVQNYKAKRIVRGGSTLTQQVIRLSRGNQKRNYWEKIIEIILATRLEFRCSKDEILSYYCAYAPFGSNVVGLEAASWRYFGMPSSQLSWAESATLAVLPNAPSLIHLGKNRDLLLQKRNQLLHKLLQNKSIDQTTYQLALAEGLPNKPFDLPQIAPHLLERIAREKNGQKIKTTIDIHLQKHIQHIVNNYHNIYKQNQIHNIAAIVIDVENRNVLSYIGNTPTTKNHQKDVDIISAPRSTGSVLKPLLYASMLDEGYLLPQSLVADVPTQISGYAPKNFENTYEGAVAADQALARSLNVPFVLLLQEYNIYNFYNKLQKYKLHHINKHPNHYGLSIILGGAESSLWDLCKTYAAWASTLNYYTKSTKYRTGEFSQLNYYFSDNIDFNADTDIKPIVGAGSIYLTFKAMMEVNRPEGNENWKQYSSTYPIAWKTGTSFGNRDAWAIGVTPKYVVGVWVGNATGEGRPELTGIKSAAPILFDIFSALPKAKWFAVPYNDLEQTTVCATSGDLATQYCSNTKTTLYPTTENTHQPCKYHKLVHLDASEKYRVNSSCEDISKIKSKNWFILPPLMEWFYSNKHADYKILPPFRADCTGNENSPLAFIYPQQNSKIQLTKDFYGHIQAVILKATHNNPNSELFWYLNQKYIGSTTRFHQMPITPAVGKYTLTIIDEDNNKIEQLIEIVSN